MSTPSAEYQHFIPQFILRNYSYPFQCSKAEHLGKKKCKCKHEKGKHPGDPVVNCVNLSPPFQIKSYPVKRIFGDFNMYNDPARAETDEQRHIESKFSKMESQASIIFQRITKSHKSGDTAVSLTRIERDLIRKFLFLLKYRGSGFHQRFYHDSPEDYSSNDRELLLDYMRERGFSTPRDVWFHNIETIIDLKMDPQREWADELPKKMFPDDAIWFVMHVDGYYMALCTPSNLKNEFILTDNCYNVFEGPRTFIRDKITGLASPGNHAGFHEFAPISPQLLIVLRSLALPNPEEDYDPNISQTRHDTYWSAYQNMNAAGSKSMLDDLPIKKCRNSYSEIIDGAVHPAMGYDGKYRPDDKFYFSYYPIKTRHVRTINSIFLENAYGNSILAFQTEQGFFNLLESYISGPCDSFKIVGGEGSDRRYRYLRELEALAKSLGSQKPLVWRRMNVPKVVSSEAFTNKQLEYRKIALDSLAKDVTNESTTAFLELFAKLASEERSNLTREIAQAGKMVYFRDVVAALSSSCSKSLQVQTMKIISSMFKASYCSRYWIYLKLLRKSQLGDEDGTQDIVDIFVTREIREGPEDIFAKTAQLYDENTLNDLMDITVLNDIVIRQQKIENIWTEILNKKHDIAYQTLLYSVTFVRPGKIENCGIPDIEKLAKIEEEILRRRGISYTAPDLPFADQDDCLELTVRVRVRSKFHEAMSGKVADTILGELKDIFFRLTFPTPPLDEGLVCHYCD